ncbi:MULTISPECIES: MFS transporter [Streptomyces]|uniref:MFS transporter n=2 Tax=Streptomyces TaxID=1883 RepID=A0ABV4ZMS6_9ACTN|nr:MULTISPECIES: MFS transporter [Streptomyces]MCK1816214.1 MFS transporter [Streptomyces sp. XM4011]QKV70214.1 MFS transporter [Streptomyces harbinensis]UWM50600.1 MFS transporter [Streptomyces carpaticus]
MSSGPGADSAPAPTDHHDAPLTTFSSLAVRNYRLFFIGGSISNIGTWMQRIAQDWLVHELTGSATAVGITTALQFLPMLMFGLYGGVLADRFDKRRLLFITQASLGITGLLLGLLTISGHVNVYHVYALAFVVGLVTVVDNPTRQTFVADMVGPRLLPNAVSLNSANFHSARLIGPAVAGVLITAVGGGWAFIVNGLSFSAPIIGLLLMRSGELSRPRRAARKKGQLREGLRYVGSRPELLWPIVLVGFIGTFGFNFPVWAIAFTDGVFDAGAGSYGLLNSLMGGGSVVGALLAARRGSRRMRFTFAAAAMFSAVLMVASAAPFFWVYAMLMVPLGLTAMTFQVTANAGIQLASDPEMRGRVISLFMMVFMGGTPIGAPVVGWVTDHFGPRVGMLSGGAVCLLATAALAMVLARIGGLRLRIDLRAGRRAVALVPRDPQPLTTTA